MTEESVYDIITELSQISDRKKQCFILIVRKQKILLTSYLKYDKLAELSKERTEQQKS